MAAAHRVYAQALFDAADEAGRLDAVREEFGDFVAAVRDVPELRELLRNPQLDSRAKAAAVEDLVGGADERFRNFLLLAIEKGRGGQLEEIHAEFERLVAARERRIEVELITAVELSERDRRRIVEQIEQASGRKVEARTRVDPALIGGVVLQVDSLRVDASVRGRLQRLRQELVTTTRSST